jgi:uroporphyrinogen-III synthase
MRIARLAMRLIVTRPAAQAQAWVQALQALQVDACSLPLLAIEPVADLAPLHAAWRRLDTQALVMFVSANAVQQFFAARPLGAQWPAAVAAASTGPGTTAALMAAGVKRVEQPPPLELQFDSEALWRQLSTRPWQGQQVLIVRGEEGRSWLADAWCQAGAQVQLLVAYRRLAPRLDEQEALLLQQAQARPDQHRWLFSSSEAVGHLRALAPQADWRGSWALASHARIAQAAREAGFERVDVVAPDPQAVAQRLAQG